MGIWVERGKSRYYYPSWLEWAWNALRARWEDARYWFRWHLGIRRDWTERAGPPVGILNRLVVCDMEEMQYGDTDVLSQFKEYDLQVGECRFTDGTAGYFKVTKLIGRGQAITPKLTVGEALAFRLNIGGTLIAGTGSHASSRLWSDGTLQFETLKMDGLTVVYMGPADQEPKEEVTDAA